MQTKKYVGPRGVENVVIEEMKTYSGAEVVTVHYDGGHKELMTKKAFELLMTEEPSDLTSVRNKKMKAMSSELYPLISEYILTIKDNLDEKKDARVSFLGKALALITEYDLKVSEVEPLLNPIVAEIASAMNAINYEIDNILNRATNFLWTKNDAEFVPGVNMMMERTLLEAKKVSAEIPQPVNAEVASIKKNGDESKSAE